MSGLCGWLTSRHARPVAPAVAQSMGAVLTRFDGARPSIASAPNAAIVVATVAPDDSSLFGNGPLVALWGQARIDTCGASVHGLVHKLARGYRDRGAHSIRGLNGA